MINYNKLIISDENKIKEKKALQTIYTCIDSFQSWCFDAGAGSGKTYTLIETIKYLLKTKDVILSKQKQKILCITYTNVAANEIKERLGSTSLVRVSTIHDLVWDFIHKHQKQLTEIHKDKIINELDKIDINLKTENWANSYCNLSCEQQENFRQRMIADKEKFYLNKNKNAAAFREAFADISTDLPMIFANIAHCKKITTHIYKKFLFENALEEISKKSCGYTKVKYDARYNTDSLNKMRISHDTLLDYFKSFTEKYQIFRQFFCDTFPIVLVDEYQDTCQEVIESFATIAQHAQQISHSFIVGYFGDSKQNIYSDGVGSKLSEIHPNLTYIQKKFNRRSSPEIINVANKIRNDNLIQESIYTSFPDGEVSFYTLDESMRIAIINHYKSQWNIDTKNPIHCLELTNKIVAANSGFEAIYRFFESSKWYKDGQNYILLREHLLSTDKNKLGKTQKLLFQLLEFIQQLNTPKTLLLKIFGKNLLKDYSIIQLRELVRELQKIKGNTLQEYLDSIFLIYQNGSNEYKKLIKHVIIENFKDRLSMREYLCNELFAIDDEKNHEESDILITNFLNLKMDDEFSHWYSFITDTRKNEVLYHTYHGTKGLEFENVIIFMKSNFGKKRDYFSNLLESLFSNNTDIDEARNLCYVATTRAIKNLAVVYMDALSEKAKSNVENVFGKITTLN